MRLYTHGHSKERGITLIALVVTIVVLLILAGVSLNLILGNNGIITKAKESRTENRMAQIDEQVKLAIGDAYTEGIGSITDSGLKSALNNRLGEGTYDITGDETTGWKVTVKETGKTYDITSNGKINSSEETGSTVDWNKILEEANKNPESFKHPEQSETNNDIGIGTDGKPVNMDLWNYQKITDKNEIMLSTWRSGRGPGYSNKNIKNGKIQGKIPAYIKPAGSDKFYTVTSMEYTFVDCKDLEEMTEEIPSKVTNFDCMYEGCTKLTKITLQNIPEPGKTGYNPSITSIIIPKNVENIDAQLFMGISLQEIIVDNENKCYSSVNGVLFDKDKKIIIAYPAEKSGESYEIPDSVTSISNGAFWGCSSLTSVTIPDSVTSIGEVAFGACTGLTSIVIPEGVKEIKENPFLMCYSLQGIEVNEKNKYYLSENGVLFDKDKKTIIAYPTGKSGESYEIPDSVTSIGNSAFWGCSSLTSVTIPDSVTSIGDRAFWRCSSLTSVAIPDSVTAIGDSAFGECSNLTSVTIPDSVTSIGARAFYGCASLTSITIPKNVSSIGNYAFENCDSLANVYFEETTTPDFCRNSFYRDSGVKTTFHFKNQEVYDAFTESYYNKNYGEKSTDFNW